MKQKFITSFLYIYIALGSIGGCGGAVIVFSNPTPPLDSDFSGGTVIFVAEETKNSIGLSSNGEDVVIVIADNEDNLIGLVGVVISSTECEIVKYKSDTGDVFENVTGGCRLEDNGNVLVIENFEYGDTNFGIDLHGEILDEVLIGSLSKRTEQESTTNTELLIQDFQFEILGKLNEER
ncbi:MAG: hypothetical protein ACE5H1_07300 [Thermodesulfobacteriota bacterium]